MAKIKRNKPRNPIANLPIMHKGGVHEKSRSGERQQGKQQLKKLVSKVEAGLSGLDCIWYLSFKNNSLS